MNGHAFLIDVQRALEAKFPPLLTRHAIRLSRIGGVDYLALQMSGQPEIVLDPSDFDKSVEQFVADVEVAVARAKEAKRLIDAEGERQ